MPIHIKCKLLKKEKLKNDIYKFTIDAKEIANDSKPRTVS